MSRRPNFELLSAAELEARYYDLMGSSDAAKIREAREAFEAAVERERPSATGCKLPTSQFPVSVPVKPVRSEPAPAPAPNGAVPRLKSEALKGDSRGGETLSSGGVESRSNTHLGSEEERRLGSSPSPAPHESRRNPTLPGDAARVVSKPDSGSSAPPARSSMDKESQKAMGARIREALALRKWMAKQMAAALEINGGTFSAGITGNGSALADRHVVRICELLNVREEWVRTGNGAMEAGAEFTAAPAAVEKAASGGSHGGAEAPPSKGIVVRNDPAVTEVFAADRQIEEAVRAFTEARAAFLMAKVQLQKVLAAI